MRNRKRKSSIKDRLDWSDKVVVMEEEQEAETFIENKETLASLEQNFEKKLVRPRMGMVADMVENEKRVPATKRLHGGSAPPTQEVIKRKVTNKEPIIKKTLMNIKPKKVDNVDIVVMEEDIEDEDEDVDFLGGRKIEVRRPGELKQTMVVEEDLRDRLGRSREEARKISSGEKRKIEEEEKSFRIRRRSREDNDTKMDLGMIVKTVVRDEHELNEMRKLEVDPEKEKYMEKERELAKQRLIEKELLKEERRLEMKERELDRERFREREIERLKEKERTLEKKRLELREKELQKVKEKERKRQEEKRKVEEERKKALSEAVEEKRREEEEAAAKERIRRLQLEEETKRREVEDLKAEKDREEKERLAFEKERAEAKRALQEERVRDELKKIDEQTGGLKGKESSRKLSNEEKQIQILKEKEERLRERLRRERARKEAEKEKRRGGGRGRSRSRSYSRTSSSSSSSSSSGSDSSSESSEEDSEEERKHHRKRNMASES